uniref:Cadherin domain-containing protein n=1 Tax=Octopus bimaculoides TaxID=37653 RepID=A0A0L8GGC3_OCTBM
MLLPLTIVLSVVHCVLTIDLTYHVEEERSPGTYVADIAADSKLLDNVKPSDQHLITFSQFKRKVAQLFNITKTGKLYTAQTLDAEDLCTFNKECSRTVKVIIKKVDSFTKILKVKIVIEDINDHEPEFPEKQIILQFREGDREGMKKSVPNAIDKDIKARDGGNPPLSSIATVLVNVINQHNNPPSIDIDYVNAINDNTGTISEKIKVGSFIAYVMVTDNDVGQNGEVSCDIKHDTFKLQSMGSKEYKIILNKPVDRETQGHYNIPVSCQDKGLPPLKSIKTLSIQVTDINDKYCQPVVVTSSDDAVEDNATMVCNYTSDTMSSKRSGRQGDLKHYEEIPGISG